MFDYEKGKNKFFLKKGKFEYEVNVFVKFTQREGPLPY